MQTDPRLCFLSSSQGLTCKMRSSAAASQRRYRFGFDHGVGVRRIGIWTILVLPLALLMIAFQAANAERDLPIDSTLQGTLEGPLLGVSCVPDAWLHLCQFPDSVVSVTSDTVPLRELFNQTVRVTGGYYLCREGFGIEVLLFEAKDALSESCPIIAVSSTSWGSIKTIYR